MDCRWSWILVVVITLLAGSAYADYGLFDHYERLIGELRVEPSSVETAVTDAALERLLADLPQTRGERRQVRGHVQQQRAATISGSAVTECWIRLDEGTPVLVLVPGTTAGLDDGVEVVVSTAFLGSIERHARDGVSRIYPVFVAVGIEPASASMGIWPFVLLLGMMLMVYMVVVIVVRRTRRPANGSDAEGPLHGDAAGLPDAAAAALAELRRRADEGRVS